MRIMQLGSSHQDYLTLFAARHKDKQSFAARMQAYVDDYYWCGHLLTPALQRLGHETFFCVPTELTSQRLWCEEHEFPWEEELPFVACLAQVAWFQPDILYVGAAGTYPDALLELLSFRPRLMVGWHATTIHPFMRFEHYDLMLSSHEECLVMAKAHGAKNIALSYPGMPAEICHKVKAQKQTDVCFSGYWSQSHPRRNDFLYQLAQQLPKLGIDCAYHLGFYSDGPSCPASVFQRNRGSVWGFDMFRAFAAARMVLNGYASVNFGPQNLSPNLRQLEALGTGSFLLTEQSDNLEAFFTAGKDMDTYASTAELVDKIQYYLSHEDERETIAAHGLATCQRQYNMDVRAKAFLAHVQETLQTGQTPPPSTLVRMLTPLRALYKRDGCLPNDDALHFVRQGLNEAQHHLRSASPDLGFTLLQLLDDLPTAELKHHHLCRALRSLHAGDRAEAALELRRELQRWPENDSARHCLSCLTLGRLPWEASHWRSEETVLP